MGGGEGRWWLLPNHQPKNVAQLPGKNRPLHNPGPLKYYRIGLKFTAEKIYTVGEQEEDEESTTGVGFPIKAAEMTENILGSKKFDSTTDPKQHVMMTAVKLLGTFWHPIRIWT